jgi:hypothetical protein
VRTVQLESVRFNNPRVMWSAPTQSFVTSWQYLTNAWYVRVRKFLADGRGGGGDTNIVPAPPMDDRWQQGNVGVTGKLFGVGTVDYSNYYPHLTILDAEGNAVGMPIRLAVLSLGSQPLWISVGGTSSGFVALAHNGQNIHQFFVSTADGGAPGEIPDGGVSPYPMGTFASTAGSGHMISDELGGTGAVMLEQNGASFLYVKPDGTTRLATGTVISSSEGTQANISIYRGSFTVSLYEGMTHMTKVVASGCGP